MEEVSAENTTTTVAAPAATADSSIKIQLSLSIANDNVLRACLLALLQVGNRPCSIEQLVFLLDKFQLYESGQKLRAIHILTRMNIYLRECKSNQVEPLFKRVVVNKTSNHYYINAPTLPTVSWITPPLPRHSNHTHSDPLQPSGIKANSLAGSNSTTTHSKLSATAHTYNSSSISSARSLSTTSSFSSNSTESGTSKPGKKYSFGTSRGAIKKARKNNKNQEEEAETDDEVDVHVPSTASLSAPVSRRASMGAAAGHSKGNSMSSGANSAASLKRKRVSMGGLPVELRPDFKRAPPFTDLVISDPFPFIPSEKDTSVNTVLVPPNTYYYVQDDRCMNKEKFASAEGCVGGGKCRSCIWKHRERLPYCFFLGFRAFLVKFDDELGGVGSGGEVGGVGVVVGDASVGESSGAIDASDSAAVPMEVDEGVAVGAADAIRIEGRTIGGKPVVLDPVDNYRVMNEVPAENMVYGPYFIPNGADVGMPVAITSTVAKRLGAKVTGSVAGSKKKAKLVHDDVLEEPLVLPSQQPQEEVKLDGLVDNQISVSLRGGASAEESEDDDYNDSHGLKEKKTVAKSKTAGNGGQRKRQDYPDLLKTSPFPFVPSVSNPQLNGLLVPPGARYHVQESKCRDGKYANYPKCRTCRTAKPVHGAFCTYVGFRAFVVVNNGSNGESFALKDVGGLDSLQVNGNKSQLLGDDRSRVLSEVFQKDLIYGPYFIPGGVIIEGWPPAVPEYFVKEKRKRVRQPLNLKSAEGNVGDAAHGKGVNSPVESGEGFKESSIGGVFEASMKPSISLDPVADSEVLSEMEVSEVCDEDSVDRSSNDLGVMESVQLVGSVVETISPTVETGSVPITGPAAGTISGTGLYGVGGFSAAPAEEAIIGDVVLEQLQPQEHYSTAEATQNTGYYSKGHEAEPEHIDGFSQLLAAVARVDSGNINIAPAIPTAEGTNKVFAFAMKDNNGMNLDSVSEKESSGSLLHKTRKPVVAKTSGGMSPAIVEKIRNLVQSGGVDSDAIDEATAAEDKFL
ncbi:hypothetical protein BDR26DRAFT_869786 [Obelidium mucronatum]|nr:hypothetical protein BDR26DRAFT_869786 [Obelidium mucronatum]